MRINLLLLGVSIFATLSAGCISMSSLQTAEILKEGEGRVLVGGGYYSSPAINKAIDNAAKDSNTSTKSDDLKLPYIELGYRRGLSESFEIGFKYTVPGTLGVDGKYSLLDTPNFDLALGMGVGYLTMESGGSSSTSDSSSSSGGSTSGASTTSDTKFKFTMVDFTVPLYASYRMSEMFAVYGSPKYIIRSISSAETTSGVTKNSKGTQKFAGASVGTMIGNDRGFAIEVTYVKDQNSKFDIMQVGGAMYW